MPGSVPVRGSQPWDASWLRPAAPLLPAGMFVPSLAVGATGGRLAGRFVAFLVKKAGSQLPVSLTAYSVIGERAATA